jgi:hypothetical protein
LDELIEKADVKKAFLEIQVHFWIVFKEEYAENNGRNDACIGSYAHVIDEDKE